MNWNKTHLENLDEQTRLHPDHTLFWLPVLDANEPTKPVKEWTKLSYAEFRAQVLAAKRFYVAQLGDERSIAKGSAIGVWLSGNYITDLCHTLGVGAAGYIPQLFSLFYSHAPVVFELLVNSGAKALVTDPKHSNIVDASTSPVPVIDVSSVSFTDNALAGHTEPLQDRPYEEVKDEIAILMHSSGSTARIPKLIPWTHRYISSAPPKFSKSVIGASGGAQTTVRVGNFNHGAAMIYFFSGLPHGYSTVMPSSLAYSSEELVNIIKFCGLTRLIQFSPFLAANLTRARQDPVLLSALQSLTSVEYGALAIAPELEQWALSVGLHIINNFANTECGIMLRSDPGKLSTKMKFIPGYTYRFHEETSGNGPKLQELVVPAGSPDLPHASLLNEDGNFYTGDLFEQTEDGYYIFRGRKNDWIKTGMGMICDTKSIEEYVKQHCKDLIADCVVVGAGRRSPALLVEPANGTNQQELPRMIVDRIGLFNQARFPHERLDDPRLVLVVESGVLPRTAAKGNIRRSTAEELFKKELDEIYAR